MRMISAAVGTAAALALSMSSRRDDGYEIVMPADDRDLIYGRGYGEGPRHSLKVGRKYPHSSARQQARYARQIAAGQISFIKHGPRTA